MYQYSKQSIDSILWYYKKYILKYLCFDKYFLEVSLEIINFIKSPFVYQYLMLLADKLNFLAIVQVLPHNSALVSNAGRG